MTAKRPSEILAASRRQVSREKRTRFLAVVDQMAARGDAVTFAAVAKTAGVSNWLVYFEEVHEHIEAARKKQKVQPHRQARADPSASPTDLELSRQQAAVLRTERDQLKVALQRHLGQQLDQISTAALAARIEELTHQNDELVSEAVRLRRGKTELEERLTEAEDDLAAGRSSLRRIIDAENTGSTGRSYAVRTPPTGGREAHVGNGNVTSTSDAPQHSSDVLPSANTVITGPALSLASSQLRGYPDIASCDDQAEFPAPRGPVCLDYRSASSSPSSHRGSQVANMEPTVLHFAALAPATGADRSWARAQVTVWSALPQKRFPAPRRLAKFPSFVKSPRDVLASSEMHPQARPPSPRFSQHFPT
ncbi:DUF6262 family protein [Streptomyces sp. WAC01526]|uniref:DUF6262 family protein n=1 Tax=Streptomyces sp. WAC01526 TaxID=2588709 RepID=UPI001CA37045|nr:DUF6262 family protein [Streptomyces sp. WAC01526]